MSTLYDDTFPILFLLWSFLKFLWYFWISYYPMNRVASMITVKTLLSFFFLQVSFLFKFFFRFLFLSSYKILPQNARSSICLLMIGKGRQGSSKSVDHFEHPCWDWQTWTWLEGDLDRYEENLDVNIFAFFYGKKQISQRQIRQALGRSSSLFACVGRANLRKGCKPRMCKDMV